MTVGRILFAGAIAFGCGALLATGAQACGNGKVIFEDKFETLDPGWGKASDRLSVDNGALVIKAEAGTGRWAMSQSDYYQDVANTLVPAILGVPGLFFTYAAYRDDRRAKQAAADEHAADEGLSGWRIAWRRRCEHSGGRNPWRGGC